MQIYPPSVRCQILDALASDCKEKSRLYKRGKFLFAMYRYVRVSSTNTTLLLLSLPPILIVVASQSVFVSCLLVYRHLYRFSCYMACEKAIRATTLLPNYAKVLYCLIISSVTKMQIVCQFRRIPIKNPIKEIMH